MQESKPKDFLVDNEESINENLNKANAKNVSYNDFVKHFNDIRYKKSGSDLNINKKIKQIHNSIHGGATLSNMCDHYKVKMIDGKPVKKKERISKRVARRAKNERAD